MSTPFLPTPSSSATLTQPSPPPPPYSSSSSSSSPPIIATTNHSLSNTLSNIGLGYAIAISFGFLVLLSALFLSSYLCYRQRRNLHYPPHPPPNTTADGGIIIPRIIFVAEDEDEENRDSSNNGVVGLDQSVINSYPKFQYSKKVPGSGGGNGDESVCSICLCDYKEGEMLRMMPDCKHYFHLCCLDAWLKLNGSCPVCRNSPLPTPLSTPLAEVVPLAQYPDNRRRRS